MQFHLNYIPPKPNAELHHRHRIFLTGSCFSENIANKLKDYRFKTYANPNGIIFNPDSIQQSLNNLLIQEKANEKFLLFRNGVFFSYHHHSSIHDEDKHDLLRKINHENKIAAQSLYEADFLIVTFGSAWVYRHLQLNTTVTNCHKQPGNLFKKQLLSPAHIILEWTGLIEQLKLVNPKLKIIFTVSPVKYLKDGVVENNLSKATLLLAVYHLIKENPGCFYFPAFELVNDDLRDYRFYKEDLAHPNEQAIDYVWNKFSETWFSESTQALNKEIHSLNLALAHRKLIANSEEAIKLNEFILKQKDIIRRINPEIVL